MIMKLGYKSIFLILVLLQAMHSIEEYIGELWNNFPPANYVCSLVSDDLEYGFIIINISFFVFGMLAWYFPVRKNYLIAPVLIWFWIIIELMNGIVHPAWSVIQKSYTPGVLTAPLLFIVAFILLKLSLRKSRE